jgi:hypothetical protein
MIDGFGSRPFKTRISSIPKRKTPCVSDRGQREILELLLVPNGSIAVWARLPPHEEHSLRENWAMSGVDIRLLQAAIAVAEELSFSRAAARLHITQPALSKQIHDLESHLGVPLFERDNQGVELTDACRALIEEARLSVLHLERAIHKARSISEGAEAVLHTGTSPSIDPYLLSMLLSVRLPLYPKLRIYRSSNFSPELSRQVMTGELEIAYSQQCLKLRS